MKTNSAILPALTVLLLGGCAAMNQPATPRYDAGFGEAVRQARALQTINPGASSNQDPVTGIDGQAGRAGIERYQESFRAPPRTFEVIGIGGNALGGAANQ